MAKQNPVVPLTGDGAVMGGVVGVQPLSEAGRGVAPAPRRETGEQAIIRGMVAEQARREESRRRQAGPALSTGQKLTAAFMAGGMDEAAARIAAAGNIRTVAECALPAPPEVRDAWDTLAEQRNMPPGSAAIMRRGRI